MLGEAGPAAGAQQINVNGDLSYWQVVFDSQTVFEVEFDPVLDRLVMTSHIANLRSVRRQQMCELLLQMNYAWRETGGVRMALDPRTDSVVMMFEMPIASLQAQQLRASFANLLVKHRSWRQIVIDSAPAPA